MRIFITLDGTICPVKKENETFENLIPFPEAKEKINKLRKAGHYIIILTKRHLSSYNSGIKNIGKVTLEWLDANGIEFDELYLGTPDFSELKTSVKFTDWKVIEEKLLGF
ncbi:hypothetical protein [Sporocytophaga myxococcoides]|uniref:hypothetical protein n=1 Tax=Sporocytophaga myxococcoides TaxID=153721 RepID=UPI000425D25A|nr:hypothetical protein [Sporocytophaga myxococcoides]